MLHRLLDGIAAWIANLLNVQSKEAGVIVGVLTIIFVCLLFISVVIAFLVWLTTISAWYFWGSLVVVYLVFVIYKRMKP